MNKMNKYDGGRKMPAPVAPAPQAVPNDSTVKAIPPSMKKSHKGKFKILKRVLRDG